MKNQRHTIIAVMLILIGILTLSVRQPEQRTLREVETNDRARDGTVIEIGDTVVGKNDDEMDYYRIEISDPVTVTITLANHNVTPTGGYMTVLWIPAFMDRLDSENYELVGEDSTPPDYQTTVTVDHGLLVIGVFSWESASVEEYTLTVAQQ